MTAVIFVMVWYHVYFILDAWHDAYIVRWKYPNAGDTDANSSAMWHSIDVIIKVMQFVAIITALYIGETLQPLMILLLLFNYAAAHLFLFDGLVNVFRTLKWFHVGNSRVDKFLQSLGLPIPAIRIILYTITLSLIIWRIV